MKSSWLHPTPILFHVLSLSPKLIHNNKLQWNIYWNSKKADHHGPKGGKGGCNDNIEIEHKHQILEDSICFALRTPYCTLYIYIYIFFFSRTFSMAFLYTFCRKVEPSSELIRIQRTWDIKTSQPLIPPAIFSAVQ